MYKCPNCQFIISNNREELTTVERYDLGEIEYRGGYQDYYLGCPKCRTAWGEMWEWID